MKLKSLITLIAILSISQISAQSSDKWRFGAFFSPDICYRTLINHDGGTFNNSTIQSRNDVETYKIGYTVGLSVDYKINRFLRIASGIGYTDRGFQTNNIPIRTFDSGDTTLGDARINDHYIYLEIPIRANFNFKISKKLNLTFGLGIGNNFYLKDYEIAILEFNDGTKDINRSSSNYKFNSYMLSGIISAGIESKITQKISLRFEPTYRKGLSTIVNAPIYTHIGSLGISSGIMYHF